MIEAQDFVTKAKELAGKLLSDRNPGRELEMVAIAAVLLAGAKTVDSLLEANGKFRIVLREFGFDNSTLDKIGELEGLQALKAWNERHEVEP